ncbi:GD12204 [Drosophila simulans]|uniref:GD12204 n=1 Tax=Drosophila simulans TaxID=7240 RepID=B4QRW1_DROSI|nr:GD12204 [Drosophila simulans]
MEKWYMACHKPPPVTQNNFDEEAARLDAGEPGRISHPFVYVHLQLHGCGSQVLRCVSSQLYGTNKGDSHKTQQPGLWTPDTRRRSEEKGGESYSECRQQEADTDNVAD